MIEDDEGSDRQRDLAGGESRNKGGEKFITNEPHNSDLNPPAAGQITAKSRSSSSSGGPHHVNDDENNDNLHQMTKSLSKTDSLRDLKQFFSTSTRENNNHTLYK